MGTIFEVITGRATNPSALAALTMNTGDSANVRSFGEGATPYLENMWAQSATAGLLRARSPRMHDSTQGIRSQVNAALPRPLLAYGTEQRLYQTDSLVLEIQGGGAEVDAAAFLMYYGNVSTGMARIAMWEQVKPLIRNHLTVQVDVTGPTVSGDWSAGNLLTSFTDLLHADTFYAVLGYTLNTASLAVALQGPDTGNYRVGGPGILAADETRSWFKDLSLAHNTPHIPIINSQNDGATNVMVAKVGTGGTIAVSLNMVELASSPA